MSERNLDRCVLAAVLDGIGHQFIDDKRQRTRLLRSQQHRVAFHAAGVVFGQQRFADVAAQLPQKFGEFDRLNAARSVHAPVGNGDRVDTVYRVAEFCARIGVLQCTRLQVEQRADRLQAVHDAVIQFA